MNQILKNITSVSLAFIVLFSTMSFTINEHYCGGDLVDTSWFVKADTCMMEGMEMSSSSESIMISDTCCNDVITIIDGQDEVKQNNSQISFQQQVFVTALVFTYSALFSVVENEEVNHNIYIPPKLVKDIQVLDETFLI